jgi:polyferredoxin
VLYDSGTLLIAFDPRKKEECINCMACVKTCPVGIDIRQGLNAACINCAECVDECTKVMSRKAKPSLIGYSFGLPGERAGVLRQNALLIGLLTAASLVFLLSLSFSRTTLDMTVLPNYDFTPRITDAGVAVNSYILSVENRGKRDLEVAVRVSGEVNDLKIIPERFSIRAGEYKRIPVYVSARNVGIRSPKDVELSIGPTRNEEMKLTRKAHFIVPGTS